MGSRIRVLRPAEAARSPGRHRRQVGYGSTGPRRRDPPRSHAEAPFGCPRGAAERMASGYRHGAFVILVPGSLSARRPVLSAARGVGIVALYETCLSAADRRGR